MTTDRRNFLIFGGASLVLAGCGDLVGPPPASPIYVLQAPIPDLVQAALVQAFEKSGGPASVAREADALHADYDLFVDIRDFEARYAVPDGVPEAQVSLAVRLATAKGRAVAGTTIVTQRVPAAANSVAAATQALGQALGTVSAGIVAWAVTFPVPPSQTKAP